MFSVKCFIGMLIQFYDHLDAAAQLYGVTLTAVSVQKYQSCLIHASRTPAFRFQLDVPNKLQTE